MFNCGQSKPANNQTVFFCILFKGVDMYVSGICTNIHLATTRET